jgi:DNA-binding winged helix-turn-helix (wHTH) protein/predicted ATPase
MGTFRDLTGIAPGPRAPARGLRGLPAARVSSSAEVARVPDRAIHFGRYRFHPTQGLTRGKREVRVTAKALAVLRALTERSGEVVTKQELFRQVWPDTVVGDDALTSCIQELRRALKDDARRPQYIETLHRRGYRFLAPHSADPELGAVPPVAPPGKGIVGREPALAELAAALARARGGERQVVFVTGEPGIGKTSLLQAFVSGVERDDALHVSWGDCVERYGAGEAYQPLLEALTRLCRQPDGARLVTALRQYAPTWLAQLPALQSPAELRALQRRTAGVTPDRMLRELTDALEAMTAHGPILLCLEDLHWSDVSTLDWISAFARRPERARLLLVGTYRPQEASDSSRSVQQAIADLRIKGLCHQLALEGLDETAVRECIVDRYPPSADAGPSFAELANLVYRHTEGNPLFVVNVLEDLVARGVLVAREERWTLRPARGSGLLGIPEGIRRTIERQIERLADEQRGLLEVASVSGGACSAAAVAAGAEMPLTEVEACVATLARQHRFVRQGPSVEWPDGTVSAGFEFLHALYRDVLHERLSPARRAVVHRRIGTRLESAYRGRAAEIAAELAMHFDQARDAARAVLYLQHAAETDRRRSAHREAEGHYRRALALLEELPPEPARDEREVALRIGLGSVLMATIGFGAPEVERTYAAAHALCRKLGVTPQLFPALFGLWLFYLGRGDLGATSELADDLIELARTSGDAALLIQGHHARWATAFSAGDLEATQVHAREASAIYDRELHSAMASTYGSHDAGVCALIFAARAEALAGRTDTAARTCDEAVALARELAHPFSLALALVFDAAVHQVRRDAVATRVRAFEAAAIAREQSFRLLHAWAKAFDGWALALSGEAEQGFAAMRASVADAHRIGSGLFLPLMHALLAESELRCDQPQEALRSLDAAFAVAARTGERVHESELYRLRGELRLQLARDGTEEGLADLEAALSIANGQGAKLLALRASLSLARSWNGRGRREEARMLVVRARQEVAEGQDLPDLAEAAAFLAGGRSSP